MTICSICGLELYSGKHIYEFPDPNASENFTSKEFEQFSKSEKLHRLYERNWKNVDKEDYYYRSLYNAAEKERDLNKNESGWWKSHPNLWRTFDYRWTTTGRHVGPYSIRSQTKRRVSENKTQKKGFLTLIFGDSRFNFIYDNMKRWL